jgi:Bifunctional DNA primase/polymerase, N-terminal
MPTERERLLGLGRIYLNTLEFGLVPLQHASKLPSRLALPGGHWRTLSVVRSTWDDFLAWVDLDPSCGLGLFMGPVSGGAVGLDADNPAFSDFLLERLPSTEAADTWLSRTGKGLCHLIVRGAPHMWSDVPPGQHVLNGKHGKLADVRGGGQYLAEPPTVHPDTRRPYTFSHYPKRIAILDDPLAFFRDLAAQFDHRNGASVSLPLPSSSALPAEEVGSKRGRKKDYRPPLSGDEAEALKRRIEDADLKPDTRQAIFDGMPRIAGDHSTEDYYIVRDLCRARFSPDDIENIYATFDVGQWRYRGGKGEGLSGWPYLAEKIKKWQTERQAIEEARETIGGRNFRVDQVWRYRADDDVRYELHVTYTGGPRVELPAGKVRLGVDDLLSAQRLRKEFFRQLGWFPELAGNQTPSLLAEAVQAAAQPGYVPPEMTKRGFLSSVILQDIRAQLEMEPPPLELRTRVLAWLDADHRYVYVHFLRLVAHLRVAHRSQATPRDIFEALVDLGAERVVLLGAQFSRLRSDLIVRT